MRLGLLHQAVIHLLPALCCVVLCSGLTEGLGVSIESLVGRSPLRDIIVACCKVGKGQALPHT
jgi:hypothetical protein